MSAKESISLLNHPAVLAFGNPLLDVTLTGDGNELLTKYSLKVDGEAEIEQKLIENLFQDLPEESRRKVTAGGSSQNTVRFLQQLCEKKSGPKLCIYCGGLGMDERGKLLKEIVESSNVDARYALHPSLPTGVCISIITDSYRSLVANIGAASVYKLEDLDKTELPLDSIKIVYIEGFFITHSLDIVKEIVKRIEGKDTAVIFNLSGTYLFDQHQEAMCEMIGLSKIVFGNVREMVALANSLNLKYKNPIDIPFHLNNLKKVTINASQSTSDNWLLSDNIFVMTQGGNDPAVVVWGKSQSAQVYPIVPSLPVIDTSGAGDALVAGFLAGILSGKDPKTCLEWGCKVASVVITNLGANLPEELPDNFLE